MDDAAAKRTIAANLPKDHQVSMLGRITGSLQLQEVPLSSNTRTAEQKPFSPRQLQDIGFEHIGIDTTLPLQLRTFSADERRERLANLRKRRAAQRSEAALVKAMPIPKPGDTIYIPTALYLGHGRDDQRGGRATVTKVERQKSGGRRVHFVTVKEVSSSYNWEQYLAPHQTEWKKEYGRRRAKPDPDNRPEFNEP